MPDAVESVGEMIARPRSWGRTLIALVVLLAGCAPPPEVVRMSSQTAAPTNSVSSREPNEKRLLKFLWPVLKSSGLAARLYYSASMCEGSSDNPIPPFPRFDLRQPPRGETGLAAGKDIFRGESRVVIAEDGPNLVRIRIGDVPDTILSTRIRSVVLDSTAQYNHLFAITAIEQSDEVQKAMHTLNLRSPIYFLGYLVVQPAPGLAHLPPTLANLSMDQALDVVARTFKGLVVYAYCAPPATYDVRFMGGVYFDDDWPNRPD